MLLPVENYFPGAILPPHLSPFAGKAGKYKPPEETALEKLKESPEDLELNKSLAEEEALLELSSNKQGTSISGQTKVPN